MSGITPVAEQSSAALIPHSPADPVLDKVAVRKQMNLLFEKCLVLGDTARVAAYMVPKDQTTINACYAEMGPAAAEYLRLASIYNRL